MPIIQMDSPLLAGLGAAAQYGQQSFLNNQMLQQLALEKLKEQHQNDYQMGVLGVDQGRLQNETSMVPHQISSIDAQTGEAKARTNDLNIDAQWKPKINAASINETNQRSNLLLAQKRYQDLVSSGYSKEEAAKVFQLYASGQSDLANAYEAHIRANTLIPAEANAANASAGAESARAHLQNVQANYFQSRFGGGAPQANVNGNGTGGNDQGFDGNIYNKSGTPNTQLEQLFIAANPELNAIYQGALQKHQDYAALTKDRGIATLLSQNPQANAAMMTVLGTPAGRRASLSYSETFNAQRHDASAGTGDFLNASAGPNQPTPANVLAGINPMLPGVVATGLKHMGGDPNKLMTALANVNGNDTLAQQMGFTDAKQAAQALEALRQLTHAGQ